MVIFPLCVMAGLDPAIHALINLSGHEDVDALGIRREDGASRLLPGHDGFCNFF
jgi:hypothetical protein